MSFSRRRFLKTGGAGIAGIPAMNPVRALPLGDVTEPQLPAAGHFSYGIASGDPTDTAVILWTQFTPEQGSEVSVDWLVATDAALTTVIQSGSFLTTSQRNFTVKVDVTGLQPGQTYFYRFAALGQTSATGQTRTAPTGPLSRARFAVVSCASYPHGYFNVYRELAGRDDLDAVLHLGDYIYEYAQDDYGDADLREARALAPAHEITTLDDYRRRHALYKLDDDLQALHQRHPMINIWDDHEFANNAWPGGAQNHDSSEGDWYERAAAARQAYFEWMPVREQQGGRIYRQFSYGDLLDLMMLDTRMEGRDEQASGADLFREAQDENRTLLGFEQEDWLYNRLQASTARWRVLGQQVMMAQRYRLHLDRYVQDDISLTAWRDSWDGYEANRQRLLSTIKDNGIDNVVVLTGDIHSSLVSEIAQDPYHRRSYNPETGEGALAVEFICPSVTSPGFPEGVADEVAKRIVKTQPHVRYAEVTTHGFVLLTVDQQQVQADWYYVSAVNTPVATTSHAVGYICDAGRAHLRKAEGPAA
ncbi:MAG TPA: alkaline phosphatase [Oceanospirillales bacterium]|nr:alkaline phosphatase [Oceanospirillaceae bacterium]HBS41050.1 alkaline phosphatase [Oceanospirillales bacterium]|tara:strand:+ start:27935 stop:29530 length:1596 start_codon:yes stop_codon:yes gene_type:complete